MSGEVQFEESEDLVYQKVTVRKKSFLIRIAMKLGAKNERQANMLLLAAAVVFFIVTSILFMRLAGVGPFNGSGDPSDLNDIPPELREPLRNAR